MACFGVGPREWHPPRGRDADESSPASESRAARASAQRGGAEPARAAGRPHLGPLCILPIIRFVNPEPAFFLAAGLYAVGWVQILRIRTASRGTMVATSGLLGNLVAGLRYMYTQPLMRSLILVTVCHCALTMAYESAFPLVARTQLGLHAAKDLFAGPPYLMIGLGAGAVLGNLALARVGEQQRRGKLFFGVGVLSGLTPILLGSTTSLPVAMLAAADRKSTRLNSSHLVISY